jgi:peptide-methionine (S)-S-oxide reductase
MSENQINNQLEEATLGAGCFWCVEAVFLSIRGVVSVESGYSGGQIKNPSYREVCDGRTGHAEVIRIKFDPLETSFAKILEVFFQIHDPTTLNRQGGDVGTQYRSVIFYHSDNQRETAQLAIKAATESGVWKDPIVTSVDPLINYYKAEDYHQNYFAQNGDNPYCAMVVRPKVDKFRSKFADLLKETVK